MSKSTELTINGSRREVPAPCTLSELMALLDIPVDEGGVAVAIDSEIVPKSEWGTTLLADGAMVEVIRATQGG